MNSMLFVTFLVLETNLVSVMRICMDKWLARMSNALALVTNAAIMSFGWNISERHFPTILKSVRKSKLVIGTSSKIKKNWPSKIQNWNKNYDFGFFATFLHHSWYFSMFSKFRFDSRCFSSSHDIFQNF